MVVGLPELPVSCFQELKKPLSRNKWLTSVQNNNPWRKIGGLQIYQRASSNRPKTNWIPLVASGSNAIQLVLGRFLRVRLKVWGPPILRQGLLFYTLVDHLLRDRGFLEAGR